MLLLQAARIIAARRKEVHDRYIKMWAKRLMVSPEQAVLPMKEIDAQLASKFTDVSPKYAELLHQASTHCPSAT